MASTELWAGLGSALAFVVGLITMAMNHVRIRLWINKMAIYFSPYIQITIHEYTAEHVQRRSDFFVAIEAYLSDRCAQRARKLKAELGSDKQRPQVSIDDKQEIMDTYHGATLWWYADTEVTSSNIIIQRRGDEERRLYRVSFHRRFRDSIVNSYLPQVLEKGRAVIADNRQRRLFTNNPSHEWNYRENPWSHVAFQHPAKFDTLAMDPAMKKDIMDDLTAFKEGKEYYTKVGKPWKRGYLLFGPPGTGKSTMIAAIADFMKYDVYDLELTAVGNNTELRRLFIETPAKSIIVIEDIDRSVDLSVKHSDKKARDKSGGEGDDVTLLLKLKQEEKDDDDAKLTLSGLLNFIDGLWSACGGERIIIFTTNNKDKLDPALIRRGRMDMHIEMSYCRYDAFKVLASNYLDMEINDHQLFEMFGDIQKLLEEVDMSPADVAEHLMRTEKRDADACLRGLVVALKNAKEHATVEGKAKAKEEVEIIHGENGGSRS